MTAEYSDLEFIPNDAQGLHVVNQESYRREALPQYYESARYRLWAGGNYQGDQAFVQKEENEQEAERQSMRRVCGMPWSGQSRHWLVAVVVLIIVAAAVGGSVGGVLGSRDKSSSNTLAEDNSSQNTTLSSQSTRVPATSTFTFATISTTTHHITPSDVGILLDCPSSNNSIYTIQQGDSEPILFRKICGKACLSTAPGQDFVNFHVRSLDDCIQSCVAYNTENKGDIASGDKLPCNNVCFRNGSPGDDFPGNCFGGLTLNSSTGGLNLYDRSICDSAAWITQNI